MHHEGHASAIVRHHAVRADARHVAAWLRLWLKVWRAYLPQDGNIIEFLAPARSNSASVTIRAGQQEGAWIDHRQVPDAGRKGVFVTSSKAWVVGVRTMH